MCLNPRPFLLRPIHRPNVKRGILIEPFYPFARETDPFFRWDGRFQEELRCRVIHARTMELEIGRNPFECPSAIKHHGAEPGRMGARTHDRHVAFVPFSLEERPGLGTTASDCQFDSSLPSTAHLRQRCQRAKWLRNCESRRQWISLAQQLSARRTAREACRRGKRAERRFLAPPWPGDPILRLAYSI